MALKTSLGVGILLFGSMVAGCGASGQTGGLPFGAADGGGGGDGSTVGLGNDASTAVSCGDDVCSASESCTTCALDCGQCPACVLAPTCSDAVGIPSDPTARHDLDQGVTEADAGPEAGPPPSALPGQDGCQNAQLRMRIASITAVSGGGEIYCIISATDGVTAEVALTGKTGSLSSGETSSFDPATAVFWGQGASLHTTTNNLTTTYDCFKVVDNAAWASALGALSSAANDAGATVGGPYGWAFGATSAAAAAAAAALSATSGDDHLFNAQQTIDKGTLLDLTNGRTWAIEKSGGSDWTLNAWDWRIGIESWGCADGAPLSR